MPLELYNAFSSHGIDLYLCFTGDGTFDPEQIELLRYICENISIYKLPITKSR